MARADLGGKRDGSLWSKRPDARLKDGLLLEVSNTQPGLTSHSGRHLLFTKVAFGYQGAWLVGGDQLGNIYLLDLSRNRFRLVHRTGQACTAIACCISRPTEVLVALADHSVQCIDTESGEKVATLRGHEASVKSLSLHSSGRHVLAVSSRDCVLWDLDSFTRCRTLNGGQEVGVHDVFYQPLTNVILTCFKDSSVHAWDSTTMDYLYQLPPPPPPPHTDSAPHYRAFTTTQDGQVMVAGGRSPFLHVWHLPSQKLQKMIQLSPKVRQVRQLLFLPQSFDGGASQVLGVLAQDGILRFLNTESCQLLFQIGSHDQPLSHAHPSPDGHYLAALSESGNVLIYDITTLTKRLAQSPVPVVTAEDEPEEEERGRRRKRGVQLKVMRATERDQNGGVRRSHKTPYKTKKLNPKLEEGERGEGGRGEGGRGEGEGVGGLDPEKLASILRAHGEYPAKYRAFIWRCLLQLPSNHAAYSSLLERGTHPAYVGLHRDYPIRSRRLSRVLQRALSALAHWSPVFGETHYLPGLVFPFVKLFQNNQLVTFELLATLLTNWCRNWFDYFPNPPLNVLAMVENCLAHHDPQLLHHLISRDITSHHYAWPLLSTLFSEVLGRSQWLRLWDHALSQPPGFLLLLTTSFLSSSRATLLHCTSPDDFQHFFHHPPSLDVGVVIQEAYRMQQTTPPEIHPEKLLGLLVPLTKGTYPVFNKYPKFIVDYQARERERIRKEEEDYLRQRQGALEMERMAEARRHEEEAWFRQQQLLLEAEEQRRRTLALEEDRLTDQRARLQAMKREVKVKELQVIDATRRKFVEHQKQVKEAQIRRLDEQIQRKVVQRDVETQAALEEVELKALELERQRVQLQHELARCQEEMLHQLDVDQSADNQHHTLHHAHLERELEEEGERGRERLAAAHAGVARAQVKRNCMETLRELERRRAAAEGEGREGAAEVLGGAGGNSARERELERLAQRLEESHLAAHTHYTHQEGEREEDKQGRKEEEGREDSEHLSTGSLGMSAVLWTRRREQLDRQEAELLRRVRGVRKKVVEHMNSSRGHSRTDSTSSQTH